MPFPVPPSELPLPAISAAHRASGAVPRPIVQALLTAALVVAAHHAMVLLHEWSHATAAWWLGLKSSPFAIHYGNASLLFADEDVDYAPLLASASPWRAALIGGAALTANVVLYVLARRALAAARVRRAPVAFEAAFWFAVFNLAELYSYMPLRAFSPGGDVAHVEQGLGVPAWLGVAFGLPFVAWQLAVLFGRMLPDALDTLDVRTRRGRAAMGTLAVALVFGLYGLAPVFYYGAADPRALWSWGSFALGAVVLAWAARATVRVPAV